MERSVNSRARSTQRGYRRLLTTALIAMAIGGCDQLLDVDVPGAVTASSLANPAMMESLAAGALGEVECALGAYVNGAAFLGDEVITSAFWRNFNIWGAKLLDIRRWTGPCQSGVDASNLGFYVALARARFMTDDAFNKIEEFPAEELEIDKAQTQARLATYGGFAYTMLGEGFCEMAIDGGSLLTPSEVMELALARFTTGQQLAQQAGDNSLRDAALLGQARVLLNLGRKAEAAAAAKQVPVGFVLNAEYSTVTGRRQNRVYLNSHRNKYISVGPEYRDLMVGGEPDTRVALQFTGDVGHDNFTPLHLQTKYPAANSPIPLASWREAQLIIAEAELGQSAVDRINALRDHHLLPRYAPANANDDAAVLAQVLEERRRELFLEGHRLNDKLRHNLPFPTGLNHKDEPYGPITCHPLPDQEKEANPNI